MDILLYNRKNEIITAYTTNDNYENGDTLTIKDEIKSYKVVDLEKYRIMGQAERVVLELQVVK